MKIKLLLIQILTATALFFAGCGDSVKTADTDKVENINNKIVAKAEATSHEVSPGAEVLLSAENSDIGDNSVTYTWTNSEGQRLGTESILTWTAPSQEGNYSITLILNFNQENESKDAISISVKSNPAPDLSPLAVIQDMIKRSGEGTLQDVTYICIGDSTRVNTVTPDNLNNTSRHIFEDIEASLQNYNVTSYLVAQGGLMFKTFNGDLHYTEAEQGRSWISVQDAINKIPNDGATSFVDFSMGSNDYSALYHLGYTPDQIHVEIKSQILRMINTIKQSKPKTKFLLTSTNPFKDWKIASNTYLAVYKEIASELNFPFVNFVDDIMPARGTTEFNAWYLDGIHFNEAVGQPAVSQFLLGKILPMK